VPSFKVLGQGLGCMGLSSSTIHRNCCWECWATSHNFWMKTVQVVQCVMSLRIFGRLDKICGELSVGLKA
jgi:hypothetical protein